MQELKEIAQTILDPYVLGYLAIIIGGQVIYALLAHWRKQYIQRKRLRQGLSRAKLALRLQQLRDRRIDAFLQSLLLIVTVIVVPVVFIQFGLLSPPSGDIPAENYAVVFILLILWFLLTGTDLLKAYLGGLAFKTLVAFKRPFAIGDRVSIGGVEGQAIEIDSFFVTLKTLNEDLVSIPTNTLWTEVLSSANAGNRSSLCLINFYLAPFVSADQRRQAEDAIWDAIQASAYFDPSKPLQIYLSQNSDSIQLTAKAYVASTYKEPLFTSDVNRAFLDFVYENNIPIAAGGWELSFEKD